MPNLKGNRTESVFVAIVYLLKTNLSVHLATCLMDGVGDFLPAFDLRFIPNSWRVGPFGAVSRYQAIFGNVK
jgi:hypothetical protein